MLFSQGKLLTSVYFQVLPKVCPAGTKEGAELLKMMPLWFLSDILERISIERWKKWRDWRGFALLRIVIG